MAAEMEVLMVELWVEPTVVKMVALMATVLVADSVAN